jgi:acetyl-CoA C-acetyltransferase
MVNDIVLVSGVRTPIGNFGGAFKDVPPQQLASIVIAECLKRAKLDPGLLDEVIFGCISQPADAANIARVAALMAGVPVAVPGFSVGRNCASGLQSITCACQAIAAGDGDLFLCGGTENMSQIPYISKGARWGLRMRHAQFTDALWEGLTDPICGQIMGRTAENVAEQYSIGRQEQDEFAVNSHKKAFMATRSGRFKDEIVPVTVEKKVTGREPVREDITQDESINPSLSVQRAALYPTVFKEGGSVTPANSCGISDGAAAVIVTTVDRARELGLEIMAYVRGYAYGGVPPEVMGIGPGVAVPKALKKAGVALSDIDLVEINEAFAAQSLAVGKILGDQGWDWAKVNVNGGAIALGHPVGASGCRILVTLMHEMKKRNVRLGLATMCVGGGQGGAIVVERR